MQIQRVLDSDVVMVFDECTPYPAAHAEAARVDGDCRCAGPRARTREFDAPGQRQRAVRHRAGRHARGPARRVARRASSTSASTATRSAACRWASPRRRCCACSRTSAPRLPAGSPRYLMGVGTPEDIVAGVTGGHRHVRLRDAHAQCAQRLALHALRRRAGSATRATGRHQPARRRPAPATPAAISRAPTCTTCNRVNEILGARLATIHNLHYYQVLMAGLRDGHRRRCACPPTSPALPSGTRSRARITSCPAALRESRRGTAERRARTHVRRIARSRPWPAALRPTRSRPLEEFPC